MLNYIFATFVHIILQVTLVFAIRKRIAVNILCEGHILLLNNMQASKTVIPAHGLLRV